MRACMPHHLRACVCLCACVRACACVCVCLWVWMHVTRNSDVVAAVLRKFICARLCMRASRHCMRLCMCASVYACVRACMRLCMRAFVYACACACVHLCMRVHVCACTCVRHVILQIHPPINYTTSDTRAHEFETICSWANATSTF